MITFFFLIQKRGVITFCGSHTVVEYDPNGPDCKECFRLHEDGYYRGGKPIITRHPNILKSVLIGKKGWGLWVDQWTEGIVDWTFTKEDILNEFEKLDVEIPDPFLIEFNNTIDRKKKKRNLTYLEQIKKK